MTPPSPDQPLQILLSREELLLVLSLLRTNWIPGIDPDPLGEFNAEQRGLSLIIAERALRARQLARLDDSGRVQVHQTLLDSVAVCAFALSSIIIHHFSSSQAKPARYFGHLRNGMCVAHTRPEPDLHLLTQFNEREMLFREILAICESENLPATETPGGRISTSLLSQVRALTGDQKAQAAFEKLTASAFPPISARLLVEALGGAHQISIVQIVRIAEKDQVENRTFTLLHGERSAWLMVEDPHTTLNGEASYLVEAAAPEKIIALFERWASI